MLYRTKGTCSMAINVEAENNIVTKVEFMGGCSGNTSGVAKLVVGMEIDRVIELLEGTTCGPRPTSCPDQLARALKQLKEEQAS